MRPIRLRPVSTILVSTRSLPTCMIRARSVSRLLPDAEVKETLKLTMRTEGLIPALESTHGFVVALKEAATMSKDEIVLVNMSGRGDKDIFTIADALDDAKWKRFIEGKADQYRRERG